MAKIKQSPKLPPEKRRAQLLKAAWQLFAKRGYRNTTIDQIARRARVTKGAFYHHFDSKEAVLMEILRDFHKGCHVSVDVLRGRQDVTPVEFMNALKSNFEAKDPADFRGMMDMWVQALRIPRLLKQMGKFYEELVDLFADVIDRSYGRTREERKRVGIFCLAWGDGVIVHKNMAPDIVDLDDQGKMLDDFLKCVQGPNKKDS